MVAEVPAAISGLKSLVDLIRTKLTADERSRINSAISEIQDKLIEEQSVSISRGETIKSLLGRIDMLEKEAAQYHAFESKTKNCRPHQIASGVFVYVDETPGQPVAALPKYCPNCFANTKVSFLQEEKLFNGARRRLVCANCGPTPDFKHYNELPAHSEPENG